MSLRLIPILALLLSANCFGQSAIQNTDKLTQIDANLITQSWNKNFKWYEWAKAPQSFKEWTMLIPCGKISLYEEIVNVYEGEVKIAAMDLNSNGIFGFAINVESRGYCGSLGCALEFYEDGGVLGCDYSIGHGAFPTSNGVKSDAGRTFGFNTNAKLSYETRISLLDKFKYDQSKIKEKVELGKTYPGGAATPDALGRTLLKALQTNNKTLWNSCLHPTELERRAQSEAAFTKFRNQLISAGLTDWSQVKFSRVTFDKEGFAGNDGGEVGGEKVKRDFMIEFTYKTDFIGGIGQMTITTINRQKYYVFFAGRSAGMNRKQPNYRR